ncbi:hypothetical protein PCK1_001634 [Pneumocystis canis]|nr:hypothetical protein PCK1_001634 [Pneumocystis canis]
MRFLMDSQDRLSLKKSENSDYSDINDGIDRKTATEPSLPNGGFEAWLQVFKSHLMIMISWGFLNSYGVFQKYYKMTLFKTLPFSKLSLIATMFGFIIIFAGFFASSAYDRGYMRLLIIGGSLLIVFGMFMSSLANEYYQIFICHSVCIGIGSGCIFIPALGVLSKYFDKQLSIATGLAASGAGIGGLLFPIVFQNLINRISFAWTMRVFSLLLTVFVIIIILITEIYRIPHRQLSPFIFSSLTEYKFVMFNIATFFIFLGIYFPFFYITVHGQSSNASDFSAYYVSVLNLTSVFGRIILSFAADFKGPLNIFIISSVALVVLTYAWIGIYHVAGLFIFSALYGFFAGAVVSLSAVVIARLSSNLDYFGTQLSVSYGFSGIGFLVGTSLVGLIVSRSGDTLFWGQIFSATSMLVGTVGLFLIILGAYLRNLFFKFVVSSRYQC